MERGIPIRGGRSSAHGRGRGYDGRGRGGDDVRGRGGGRGRGASTTAQVFTHNPPVEPRLDQALRSKENQALSTVKAIPSQPIPPRPGYGTRGREVILWANYFELTADSALDLQRYNIQIKGPRPAQGLPKRMVKRIISLFLREHNLETVAVTDFGATVLTLRPLNLPQDGYSVTYCEAEEDEPSANAAVYTLHLQHTGVVSLNTLLDQSTSSNCSSLFGPKQETIQALNIMLGHFNKSQSRYAVLSRGRTYDTRATYDLRTGLGAGLEVIRGFMFSVRAATARVLVNVQIKNLAFYQSGPLVDIVKAFIAERGQSTAALETFLRKLKVDVTHIVRTNRAGARIPRIKTIVGLAHTHDGRALDHPPRVPRSGAGPGDVEFYLKGQPVQPTQSGKKKAAAAAAGSSKKPSDTSGRYISVAEFFKQQYGTRIIEPGLPVVNVGTTRDPSYLPLQVCHVVAGQPGLAKLSPAQTQQMIRFSVRKPNDNATSIVSTGLQQLGLNPGSSHLDAFGVHIKATMLAVPGRVLQAPEVRYAAGSSSRPSFASWNLQAVKLARPATLGVWTYLVISPEESPMVWPSKDGFHATMDRLTAKLRGLGVQAPSYIAGQMIRVRQGDAEGRVAEAVSKFAANPEKRPRFVLVALPASQGTALYNKVKQACDVQFGLLNVCVIDNKFAQANDQYLANVCLKINLKLGGSNHLLDPSKLGVVAEKQTMLVGIDVTHPSPGSTSTAPSVAAIVASIDSTLAQWPAELRVQTAREEMVAALEDMVKSRLRLWQTKNNNAFPKNIIVYRDGVSEGQYQLVLDNELPAIRNACRDLYPATETKAGRPRVSIIIVGKRHHTRFYATRVQDADRSGNPQNGTVVDRAVTESHNWDFFLQAHTALQGTARPAHYFVILDEIFRGATIRPPFASAADVLEDLTHNLCYLFGRATKAVSICPPAYYADLACERARCYLSQVFDPSVSSASDTASNISGTVGANDSGSVQIHDAVKDAMFYI